MRNWRSWRPFARSHELFIPDIWDALKTVGQEVPAEEILKFAATKKTVHALNRLHSRREMTRTDLLNIAVQLLDHVDVALTGDVRLILQYPDGRQMELALVRRFHE